ncbi:MAG: ABC transporter permease [Gemmatimonadetes bacterium]|nr:ABC transporter permease [Gemmatimonadota bacterium]
MRRILEHLGRSSLLAAAVVSALPHPQHWLAGAFEEARRQAYGALPLVLFLTGLGGAVTSQQTGYQFEGVLPYWVIGSVVAASVITELAPLLTGIALVGVVGARIAAELGAMEVTEQVDALEVIGRDPVTYLVVPRVLAGLLAAPVLVALALAASLFAGWGVAVLVTPVTSAEFWFGVRYYMRDFPLFFALIKGAAFGLSITFIASYVGLQARGGSRGVGRATTRAVVAMVSALLVLDTLFAPLLKLVPS